MHSPSRSKLWHARHRQRLLEPGWRRWTLLPCGSHETLSKSGPGSEAMRVRALAFCTAVSLCLVASSADSADLYGEGGYAGRGRYCQFVENAHYLLSLDSYTLRQEVTRRYFVAVDVFNRPSTVYSTTPLFEWANQTKIACAKAIGYLRRHFIWGPEINVESIQKCECFYDRMIVYLGRHGARY